MKSIKPLSEVVHSSLRSGILLFDLSRVVEELVYNSLDAGATKVSVYVGMSTCFVKVIDNGTGITRDGLAVVGERFATSKLQNLNDMGATSRSFGFRGEALGSISDFSLIEIVTKPLGRPNGFRKILKGCRCLYLGIDDGQDVGTTVTVRDLFYNQPVRRKLMQSSPKKALHSIKTSVLRIALVRSMVSFNVVDIESEEELLRIHASSTTLSLLKIFFGIDVSSSLHKVNLSVGVLEISGYVSGPFSTSSVEALQYVYINSQFVHKGPIHKLLNQLPSSFNSVHPWKSMTGGHKLKRSRSQASPLYFLNLSCPRSWYDIAVEPLKTTVEFKEWGPILNFIEKAVSRVWSGKIPHADVSIGGARFNCGSNVPAEVSFDGDFLEDSEIVKDTIKICDNHDLLGLSSAAMGFPLEDIDCISHWNDSIIPFKKLHRDTAELKRGHIEIPRTPSYFQFRDSYLSKCTSIAETDSDKHPSTLTQNRVSEKDDPSDTTAEVGYGYWENYTSGSRWGTQFQEADVNMNTLRGQGQTCDFSKMVRTPFLQNYSFQGLPIDALEDRIFDYKMEDFGAKRNWINLDERIGVAGIEDVDETIKFLPSNLWQDEITNVPSSSRIMKKFNECSDADFLPTDPLRSSGFDGCCFLGEIDLLLPTTATQIGNFGLGTHSDFENGSANLNRLYGTKTTLGADDFTCRNACLKKMKSELRGESIVDVFSTSSHDILMHDEDWISSSTCSADNTENCVSPPDFPPLTNFGKDKSKNDGARFENYVPKERLRRCNSCPPFYRGKKKFFALNIHQPMKAERLCANSILPEISNVEQSTQSLGTRSFMESSFTSDSSIQMRSDITKMENVALESLEVQNGEKHDEIHGLPGCQLDSHTDLSIESYPDLVCSGVKLRTGIAPSMNEDKAQNIHDHCNILDISSGVLNFAADSLVPDSISKDFLEDANVLPQVDKKFIPVVAGGTLAIIDQHAADERIRLEDLQQNVLSGKMRTITHLDAGLELVLPEIEYQLMHNYSEQIRGWGWMFNNFSHQSNSFKKNLNLLQKQPTTIKLLAVPCILGVNLSDRDLVEFLQQLADTDGSSTMPPAVVRVLNFKACRGAVMFGDALVPSECSLIVEELKRTSLRFQCAHGRPTTVPIVNLEALHKHIAKYREMGVRSDESWHGLRRCIPNVERAARRLGAAQCRG